jgi:hypothetical protein
MLTLRSPCFSFYKAREAEMRHRVHTLQEQAKELVEHRRIFHVSETFFLASPPLSSQTLLADLADWYLLPLNSNTILPTPVTPSVPSISLEAASIPPTRPPTPPSISALSNQLSSLLTKIPISLHIQEEEDRTMG